MSADDEDMTPEKPDYSGLSIGDLLTRLQRQHIENLLALAESNELPNAQVLAQINRYLMDNGIVVMSQPMKTIDGQFSAQQQLEGPTTDRPALPDYTGQDYNE